MATSWTAISTVTVGSGGAASVNFTSIPSTYTDLCVKYSLRSDYSAFDRVDLKLNFNSSTTGWTDRYFINTGSAAVSGTDGWAGAAGYPAAINTSITTSNTFTSMDIYIPNYASSNNKSWSVESVEENNSTAIREFLVTGLWSNSSAISSIQIVCSSGNFVQYSTATLFGIKNS